MEPINGDQAPQSTGERIRKYLAQQPYWLKIGVTVIGIYLLTTIPIMIWDLA